MTDRLAHGRPALRLCVRVLTATVVAAELIGAGLAPARAQDTANSGASFWIEENRRMQRQRAQPAPVDQRVRRLVPHKEFARPTIMQVRPVAVAPAIAVPAAVTPVEKPEVSLSSAPPAGSPAPGVVATVPGAVATVPAPAPGPTERPFTVAVVGDGFAIWLASGLTDAFPAGGGVTVLGKGRDGSGLAREDLFDWPKAVREMLAGPRIDAVVVMIGANDRQPLRGAAGAVEPFSAAWEALYAKRIEALVGAAKDRKVPVLWVGIPIVKNERVSLDIGALNEIERTRSEAAGARFIDVFDAFADEKGQFSAFGPDVNGQIVKLRTNDGVLFTQAGARKLAHFVEGDLRRLREPAGAPPVPVLPADVPVAALPVPDIATTPSPVVAVARAPDTRIVPERAAIGPVVPLTLAPSSPGGELLGRPGVGAVTDAQRAAVELLLRPRDAGLATSQPRPQ